MVLSKMRCLARIVCSDSWWVENNVGSANCLYTLGAAGEHNTDGLSYRFVPINGVVVDQENRLMGGYMSHTHRGKCPAFIFFVRYILLDLCWFYLPGHGWKHPVTKLHARDLFSIAREQRFKRKRGSNTCHWTVRWLSLGWSSAVVCRAVGRLLHHTNNITVSSSNQLCNTEKPDEHTACHRQQIVNELLLKC
jgi:hypothetical protein